MRVNATAGVKGLFTTFLPWCAPFIGFFIGFGFGALFGMSSAFLGATVGLALGLVGGYRVIREVESAAVQGYLRNLSSEGRLMECPLCGHDQRGTTSPRCTECACNVKICRAA